jgi:hypothetical protein
VPWLLAIWGWLSGWFGVFFVQGEKCCVAGINVSGSQKAKTRRVCIYLTYRFGQDVIAGRRPIASQLWSRLKPNQLPRPTLSANDSYYLGLINEGGEETVGYAGILFSRNHNC